MLRDAMSEQRFLGNYGDAELPAAVQRGCQVTIKKGVTIYTTMPGQKQKKAGRTYKIYVHHIGMGSRPGGLAPNGVAPRVVWPGEGGYWHEVDLNDIPEALASSPTDAETKRRAETDHFMQSLKA